MITNDAIDFIYRGSETPFLQALRKHLSDYHSHTFDEQSDIAEMSTEDVLRKLHHTKYTVEPELLDPENFNNDDYGSVYKTRAPGGEPTMMNTRAPQNQGRGIDGSLDPLLRPKLINAVLSADFKGMYNRLELDKKSISELRAILMAIQ